MSKNSITVPRCSEEYYYVRYRFDMLQNNSIESYLRCLDEFFKDESYLCSYAAYLAYCNEHQLSIPKDAVAVEYVCFRKFIIDVYIQRQLLDDSFDKDGSIWYKVTLPVSSTQWNLLVELGANGISTRLKAEGNFLLGYYYNQKAAFLSETVEPVKPEPAEASPEVPEDDAPEEFIEPECVPDLPFSYSDLPFPEVLFQQRELLTYLDYLDNNLLCVNYICCIIEFNYYKRFVSSYAAYCEFALNNGFRVESYMDAFKSLLEFSILYQESIIEGGDSNAG